MRTSNNDHGSTLQDRLLIMKNKPKLSSTQLGYHRVFTPSHDSNVLPQSLHEFSTYNRGES